MLNRHIPLVAKLSSFASLSDVELEVLCRLNRPKRSFAAGNDLMHEGQRNPSAYFLVEGWVISYKVLRGGGRQIVDFQIPGDFLGLRSVLLRTADHNIEPITPIVAVELAASDVLAMFRESPRLAAAILWALSADESVVVERLVSLGRRDAMARVGHFFLEFGARLQQVGLATREGYDCPLSQYHLADALGLSAVHINRVLRQLREDGLMTFRGGKVIFDDFDRLVQAADFDMAYLDREGPLLK